MVVDGRNIGVDNSYGKKERKSVPPMALLSWNGKL